MYDIIINSDHSLVAPFIHIHSCCTPPPDRTGGLDTFRALFIMSHFIYLQVFAAVVAIAAAAVVAFESVSCNNIIERESSAESEREKKNKKINTKSYAET